MERSVRILLAFASLVLAAVVFLAFHDFAEAHTARDWLSLLSAVVVWSATALSLRPVSVQQRNVTGASRA